MYEVFVTYETLANGLRRALLTVTDGEGTFYILGDDNDLRAGIATSPRATWEEVEADVETILAKARERVAARRAERALIPPDKRFRF